MSTVWPKATATTATAKPRRIIEYNYNRVHYTRSTIRRRFFRARIRIVGTRGSAGPDRPATVANSEADPVRGPPRREVWTPSGLAQTPGDPRIFNLLGVVEAQENNFMAAQSDFEKAIKAAPRFSGPYINLGRLYQEHSNEPHALENARTTYTKLLAFEPANIEANYQAAVVEHRLGLFAQSLQHLSRLPADAQGRSPALALRCADLTGLGRVAEAQKTAKQLAGTQDLAETDVVSIVPALIEHHSEEMALNLLQSLASRGLASPHSLHRLAALAEARGQFQQARDALEKDLQSEAPSVPLLTQLARISYRAHDLDGALGYLARARDLAPDNAAVHFFFGVICIEQKLPPEAKKSLSEAVRLDPTNPYYNYALGAVLVGQKNPDEAIPYFRRYVKSKPEDPRGRFALGVAYYDSVSARPGSSGVCRDRRSPRDAVRRRAVSQPSRHRQGTAG